VGGNCYVFHPVIGMKNCLGVSPKKKKNGWVKKNITLDYNPVNGKWSNGVKKK
jgi:hypothetical protein